MYIFITFKSETLQQDFSKRGSQNLDSSLCKNHSTSSLCPIGIPHLTLIPPPLIQGLKEVWCSQAPHPPSAMPIESDVAFLKVIDM